MMQPRTRQTLWIAITALYWGGMAVATHLPLSQQATEPGWLQIPHLDKLVHFVGYAGLAFLICRAVDARSPDSARAATASRRFRLPVLLTVAAYGALDELTQPFFARHCDPADYAVDLLGGLGGVLLARPFRRRRTPAPRAA